MKFVVRNALRSFVKNLFSNIVLIVELAVCFWLFCMLINTYFDMGTKLSRKENLLHNDAYYYQAIMKESMLLADDLQNMPGTLEDTDQFINELKNNSEFGYMNASFSGQLEIEESFLDQKVPFSGTSSVKDKGTWYETKGYRMFLYGYGLTADILDPSETDGMVTMNTKQIDYNAYQNYALTTIEKTVLIPDDFVFHEGQSTLPLLLGYDYKDYFKAGDTIPISYNFRKLEGKVVGILEKDAILSLEPYTNNGGIETLNGVILSPLYTFSYTPKSKADIITQTYHHIALVSGCHLIVQEDHDPISVTKDFYNLCSKYNMTKYSPVISSATSGLQMFRGESERSIQIIFGLVIILGLFCVFVLITNILMKIDENSRVFMINMMNGATLQHIILQYLIEIFSIVFLAGLTSWLLLRRQVGLGWQFPCILIGLAVITLFLASFGIYFRLKKLKTDQLLRRKD